MPQGPRYVWKWRSTVENHIFGPSTRSSGTTHLESNFKTMIGLFWSLIFLNFASFFLFLWKPGSIFYKSLKLTYLGRTRMDGRKSITFDHRYRLLDLRHQKMTYYVQHEICLWNKSSGISRLLRFAEKFGCSTTPLTRAQRHSHLQLELILNLMGLSLSWPFSCVISWATVRLSYGLPDRMKWGCDGRAVGIKWRLILRLLGTRMWSRCGAPIGMRDIRQTDLSPIW